MIISGFINSIRRYKEVIFIDIVVYNSFSIVKLVSHDFNVIDSKITTGSFIEVDCEKENDTENFIIKKLITLKTNYTKYNSLDASLSDTLSKSKRYMYWRYLNNRKIILYRSTFLRFVRNWFESRLFWEFSTPIITAPEEGGARNFIIPSRLHEKKYYALAQSPQIYKQMVIYSGFNYYQIAPCFRDEDSRSDRSNGEFYQIDVEMKATDEVEVYSVAKRFIMDLASEFNIKTVILEPYSYNTAISKYQTDKPKLSIENFKDHSINNKVLTNCIDTRNFTMVELNNSEINNIKWIVSIITPMPMFESGLNGNLVPFANPFADVEINEKSPIESVSKGFDFVINGIEILSGSLRNIDYDKFTKVLKLFKINENKFHYMKDAFESGIPQHGGFGMGFERILTLVLKTILDEKIEVDDVISFPMTDKKQDVLIGAPREI